MVDVGWFIIMIHYALVNDNQDNGVSLAQQFVIFMVEHSANLSRYQLLPPIGSDAFKFCCMNSGH